VFTDVAPCSLVVDDLVLRASHSLARRPCIELALSVIFMRQTYRQELTFLATLAPTRCVEEGSDVQTGAKSTACTESKTIIFYESISNPHNNYKTVILRLRCF
jgi:hypothetical protein